MAVTEVMHDPEFVPTLETNEQRVIVRGAPCLFCGEWIDSGSEAAFRVLVLSSSREGEYAAHSTCLEAVRHPSVPLPS
jgi:hypothetical protein